MPDALQLDGIEYTKALLAHHHAFGDYVHPGGGRAAAPPSVSLAGGARRQGLVKRRSGTP